MSLHVNRSGSWTPNRKQRAALLAILSAVFLAAPTYAQSYSERILSSEPFAYWRFDEEDAGPLANLGSAAITANSLNNIEHGEDGLADPDNAAIRFPGLDEDSDPFVGSQINISNSSFINAGGPWEAKTIELWFSADDPDTIDEQLIYEQGGSTRGITIYVQDGQVHVGAHNSANDDGGIASPWPAGVGEERGLAVVSTDIDADTAYHLAMVYEGDATGFGGTITGYLDGESFGTVDDIGLLFGHTDGVSLGGVRSQALFASGIIGNEDPTLHYFQGVVDELALYDRALSAGRIGFHLGADLNGDFNDDGDVNLQDFIVLANNFNAPGDFEQGDINFDEQVDMRDFLSWRQIFQAQNAPAGAAVVPEPNAAMLVLIALGLLPALRRRRCQA